MALWTKPRSRRNFGVAIFSSLCRAQATINVQHNQIVWEWKRMFVLGLCDAERRADGSNRIRTGTESARPLRQKLGRELPCHIPIAFSDDQAVLIVPR